MGFKGPLVQTPLSRLQRMAERLGVPLTVSADGLWLEFEVGEGPTPRRIRFRARGAGTLLVEAFDSDSGCLDCAVVVSEGRVEGLLESAARGSGFPGGEWPTSGR